MYIEAQAAGSIVLQSILCLPDRSKGFVMDA
jgi:hypothetical protein